MDLVILKKRLISFKSPKGNFRNVPDEVLVDVLRSWEQWTGASSDFSSSLGSSRKQIGALLRKARALIRSGIGSSEFKELNLESLVNNPSALRHSVGIELTWQKGTLIRFPDVDQLIDFLKKAA